MVENKSYSLMEALQITKYGKDWDVMLRNQGLIKAARAMDENAKTY